MPPKADKRVLVIASGGGHWVQMRRLREAFDGFDAAYVSVYPDYAADVAGKRYYTVTNMTRFNVAALFVLAPQLLRILIKERPRAVITTGSAPGLVCLALAKTFFGARTVWIDSIANCERLSSSGRQARRFADAWLTQWPHLAGGDGGPQYWGAVL
jgi:hypothetical protein